MKLELKEEIIKQEIFISYSAKDNDKIKLIEDELKGNKYFKPLIIANKREAQKPLTSKVIDGIERVKVIVPILTKQSISTQWINQEIGYSKAKGRTIIPLVEKVITRDLKGFIHQHNDLPYTFLGNENKAQENKNFIVQFRNLISDLEKEIQSTPVSEKKRTKHEEVLEKIDLAKKEEGFQKKRKDFLQSTEVSQIGRMEFLNMVANSEAKIKDYETKGFHFGVDKDEYKMIFIARLGWDSITYHWNWQYVDTIEEAILTVRLWDGSLTIDNRGSYAPGEEPKVTIEKEYRMDLNKNEEIIWKEKGRDRQYNIEEIVDQCLGWIIDTTIARRKLKG